MAAPTKERLHQIAERKLAALGVQVERRQGATEEELCGVLLLSTRVLGGSQTGPHLRTNFVVVDHDKLRFAEPPFHHVGVIVFYDCETPAALEGRIRQKLEEKSAAAAAGERRLRGLGLDARVDPERLVGTAIVQIGVSRCELEADPQGVRVARIHSGKHVLDVTGADAALRVEQFKSRIDLELYLGSHFAQWEQAGLAVLREREAARKQSTKAAPAMSFAPDVAARLQAVRASSEVPTLGDLVERLGPLVVPNRLEVVQDFVLGQARYRFVATHEAGTRFRGALFDAGDRGKRPLWEDVFDVTRIHGLAEIVTYVLGLESTAAPAAPESVAVGRAIPAAVAAPAPQHVHAAGPPLTEGTIPEHLFPRPGETWLMNVRVEGDDGHNISYVTIDVDGRSWGGTRTLPRAEFDAMFADVQGGRRMSILVDDVRPPDALYRQLDPQGNPIGDVRRLPIAQLVATFMPAASVY